jgi:CHAD domain-containing protein
MKVVIDKLRFIQTKISDEEQKKFLNVIIKDLENLHEMRQYARKLNEVIAKFATMKMFIDNISADVEHEITVLRAKQEDTDVLKEAASHLNNAHNELDDAIDSLTDAKDALDEL